jgi:putative two-component system response regulator
MMPGMDGYEVCRRLKRDPRTQAIPVIMLTALSEVSDKVKGLDSGADDFLNKPVRREELLARVRSLVRVKRLRDELDSSESVIFTMVQALESKDPRRAGHSERVAAAAMAVARRLGLSPHEREAVAKGALLHDIGKLGLPDELLRAEGPLSAEQHALYRQHPDLGERILLPLRTLASAREIVRHHHERLDGSGYPDALFGNELPRGPEIVGVANLYDDLVHVDGLSPDDASRRLREEANAGRFHQDVVECFLETGAAVVGTRGEPPPDAWGELRPAGGMGGTILVGDDTDSNREMLACVLEEAGFRVVAAADGQAVLRGVTEGGADLVILDIRMPVLDGLSVCRRLKSDPDTEFIPVILVTASLEGADRMRGIEAGADDFLPLPVNRLELLARVRSLLRLRTYSRDLEEHQNVVLSLATMLEAKHPYTRGHSTRVGDLVSRLASEVGLSGEESELLRVAGLLHDIGQFGIRPGLIDKPGTLTDDEFREVKEHAASGENLCRPLKSVQSILPFIRHHHERFDGTGYPDRLEGDKIPVGARLLSLADAYDALTSERSYRKRLAPEEALSVLSEETRRGCWDPDFFQALCRLVRRDVGSAGLS